ncbi:MAG TPA: hypothetical protein VF595_04480 [Tepidisphaeraceae bacterium]|jgi:hypothetical protein
MHRTGFTRTIGLVACVVVVVGILLYMGLQPPAGWPDESRRVVHPAGFSIAQPRDWEPRVSVLGNSARADSIRLLPKTAVGSPGFFTVTKLPESPTDKDLLSKGYAPTTMSGQSAWQRVSEQKMTREHTRSVVFQRDGVWFDIVIRRPSLEPLDAGLWAAYVDSFRTETVRKTTPATLPIHIDPARIVTTTTAPS